MSAINVSRVLLGGLAAGLVLNVGELLLTQLFNKLVYQAVLFQKELMSLKKLASLLFHQT
jgi:hypothetical protein